MFAIYTRVNSIISKVALTSARKRRIVSMTQKHAGYFFARC